MRFGNAAGLLYAICLPVAAASFDQTWPVALTAWVLAVRWVYAEPEDRDGALTALALALAPLGPLTWVWPRIEKPAISTLWPGPMATSFAVGRTFEVYGNIAMLVFSVFAGGALGFVWARVVGLIQAKGPNFVARFVRLAAPLAVAAALVSAAIVTWRTVRLPSVDVYLANLPVMAQVGPMEEPTPDQLKAGKLKTDTVGALDLQIERTWIQSNYTYLSIERGGSASRYWPNNLGFTIRHDPRTGLLFLDDGAGPRAIRAGEDPLSTLVFEDIAPWVKPPRGWAVQALGGWLLLGLLAVSFRQRVSTRPAKLTARYALLLTTALLTLSPQLWSLIEEVAARR